MPEQTARDTFESYVNNIRGRRDVIMYTRLLYSKGIEFPPKSTRNKENEKVLSLIGKQLTALSCCKQFRLAVTLGNYECNWPGDNVY